METKLSIGSVAAFVNGQELGHGTLKVQQQELTWEPPVTTELSFKVHYTYIRKYGMFSSFQADSWRRGLTVVCNLEGQTLETTVFFLLDGALTCVLDILIDLVPLDPTIHFESMPKCTQDSKDCSRIRTSLLKTHVTCLKFIGEILFAGIGDTLHIFSKHKSESDWTCLMSRQICQGQNIYGIEGNGSHLVVYGGKTISFLRYSCAFGVSHVRMIYSFTVQDWVLDCIWLNGGTEIAVLTANNVVISYCLRIHEVVQSFSICCSERCILYSGKLLGASWNEITVLAGTVFSSIIIWSNNQAQNCGNVMHELKGHKGVIFSITFCEQTRRICSTSDDRTARVWDVDFDDSCALDWKNCSISLTFSLYGHSARVWKSKFLFEGKVVSVGEDSRICLWNKDGTLDNQWSGHQGGEIWSLDVSKSHELIATGGSDGGISLWPITKAPLPQILTSDSSLTDNTPRCVGLTQSGSPLMMNTKGDILLHSKGSWQFVFNDSRFSSYCLQSVSPNRTMVAFGSITGCVLICRVGLESISKCVDFTVCDGRIFSLVWLSDNSLVVCEAGGVFSIWNLSVDSFDLEKAVEFVLPSSRERWITSCAANELYVICGDRAGSLFLYLKSGDKNPIFCAKRIHGHNGVTDVKLIGKKVLSTGRDGKYREFIIEKDKLVLLRCSKLKLDWAAAIIDTDSLQRILVCFHDVFFVVWSVQERRSILKIDCGGGHRSWDCLIDCSNDSIHMTYIKGKSVFYCCVPVRDVMSHSLVHGTHSKAINAAAIVPVVQKSLSDRQPLTNQLVLLGGEDTTLRLVSVGINCETQLAVLQSHLSSIRTIVCYRSDFLSTVYVVSGGGRGQFIVWRILDLEDDSMLEIIELSSYCVIATSIKNQEVTHDSAEMRIMDLVLSQYSSETLTIAAACSDGFLRLFSYNILSNTISHLEDVDRRHCLLKILYVEWDISFLVSACTSGLLVFHNLGSNGFIEKSEKNSYSVGDSGINSCDYKLLTDHLVVSCAGDDAYVNITVFELMEKKLNMKYHWKNKTAHTCQVSGLKMAENWLFTAGLDRSLTIFFWTLDGGEFKASQLTQFRLGIPDVHGTLVWRQDRDDKISVYVHGLGSQLLRFSSGE